MCNFPPAFCSSFYFNLSLLKKKIENKDEAKPVQSFTEREKKKLIALWVMTLSLKPSLLCSSFISELEGELKEPTPLFEKRRVHFLGCGV